MDTKIKKVKYPENRHLKIELVKADKTISELAEELGYSRTVVSLTVNGHYKGDNIVPKIKEALGLN